MATTSEVAEFIQGLCDLKCGTIRIELNPVVNGIVSPDYVAVTSCPPRALEEITRQYQFAGLEHGRVLVRPADPRP